MKNIILLLLILSGLFQWSCHQEIFIDEDSEIAQRYKNYEVDFFTSHMNFKIQEAVFETVTEQVFVKEAHRSGAIFETFTEQVLLKEAFSKIKTVEVHDMNLLVNAEMNMSDEIGCYHFLDPSEFTTVDFPAEYTTRIIETVVVDGNGPEIPAVYSSRQYKKLKTPFQITPLAEERIFLRVSFRIPYNISIEEYLADQFFENNLSNCLEGNSYRIVE